MLSLRELQTRFAATLLAESGSPDGQMAVYRNTIFANYRKALRATYPVVHQLVDTPFFDAVVDAYVRTHPSTGGDLNVYGDRFGAFLANYPHARDLPYLPDVARLEWAVDEASRAANAIGTPEALLSALATIAAKDITLQRFRLDPSCRFVASEHPVLRIWQVHQPTFEGDPSVNFRCGTDWLMVRREHGVVVAERLEPGEFALLRALGEGQDLATALGAALAADMNFDLGTTLRTCIANRSLAELRRG